MMRPVGVYCRFSGGGRVSCVLPSIRDQAARCDPREVFHSSGVQRSHRTKTLWKSEARCFSSNQAYGSTQAPESMWKRVLKSKHFRRIVFAVRAGSFAFSLYGLGYVSGMQAYASNPEKARMQQIIEVLKGVGAIGEDGSPRVFGETSPDVKLVNAVWPRVLAGARSELQHLIRGSEQRLDVARNSEKEELRSQLENLKAAQEQINGWRKDGFIIIGSNTPNAFVHSLVPQMIFIFGGIFRRIKRQPIEEAEKLKVGCHAWGFDFKECKWRAGAVRDVLPNGDIVLEVRPGMLTKESAEGVYKRDRVEREIEVDGLIKNEEQLAMLLGHEVAHVIHRHNVQSVSVVAISMGCQLVLLALLDPTGAFSWVADFGLQWLSKFAVQLPMSRAHEREADSTGLRICARAGFDPRIAATFFDRMQELENEVDHGSKFLLWTSTHPRSEDRAKAMRESTDEAMKFFSTANHFPVGAKPSPINRIWSLTRY